jgi:hypothetical protein
MNKILSIFHKSGKPLGISFIAIGIGMYFYKLQATGIIDWTGTSKMIALGCISLFFSKSKQDDERVFQLKFYAIALSFLLSFVIIDLFNYLALNFSSYKFDKDTWSSVTAYDFIITCMVIAISTYHIMRYKDATVKGE